MSCGAVPHRRWRYPTSRRRCLSASDVDLTACMPRRSVESRHRHHHLQQRRQQWRRRWVMPPPRRFALHLTPPLTRCLPRIHVHGRVRHQHNNDVAYTAGTRRRRRGRFCVDSQGPLRGSHLLFGAFERTRMKPVKLVYDPSQPDGWLDLTASMFNRLLSVGMDERPFRCVTMLPPG